MKKRSKERSLRRNWEGENPNLFIPSYSIQWHEGKEVWKEGRKEVEGGGDEGNEGGVK